MQQMTVMILLITLLMNIALPLTVCAVDSGKKVVRVGWHEPPYFMKDANGRQSGYSYEYQQKVAAYTGWEYEYVEGTWSELMQKLKDGEIDLMSDISYTEERSKYMLYSSIPMGTEAYYVFVSPNNQEISSEDLTTLNGKKVGVAKGSIQKEFFVDWAEQRGLTPQIMELSTPEEETVKLLTDGRIDAFVTLDVYSSSESAVPVWKIGSSDFFFAVKKDRPDILTELDDALNKIQDEDKYYAQHLHDKYLRNVETSKYLTVAEKKWINNHGTIKIGYQDNYLAFCAQDPATGKLTGALSDYLEYASAVFENVHLKFEAICYPTAAAALDALKNGEIDCMFPANLTSYDAEQLGLVMTPTIMSSGMNAIVRESDQKEFVRQKKAVVCVNEGNTNYEIFLSDNYPDWEKKYYPDTPTGLEAIARKEADCLIISSYRYSNISKQCEKLHLTQIYTGVDMDYYIAVRKGESELYSILARITNVVPPATIHTALTYYSTEDVKSTFVDLIKDNLFLVMSTIAVVLLIILILLLRSIKAEKKILEEERVVKDLNKRAYVDALTSVRNKGAFSDYIQKLQERIEDGEELEFAVGIFDCNNLKLVNDEHGHDKGDIYLKKACQLICRIFDHSPVFRIGGDEFAVVLQNDDFTNRDELVKEFQAHRKEISDSAENKWEEVDIAMGIAVYDPQNDSSVSDTVRNADRIMYENKRLEKTGK